MIGYLRGVLVGRQPPNLTLEVHGVGYELEAPLSVFSGLPDEGAEVTLHTHLAVREDAHTLYAFASAEERALFRSLIRISGIGAKLALVVLSGFSTSEFARRVRDEDAAALARLPGIGPKTAQRVIIEMRDRLPQAAAGAAQGPSAGTVGGRVDDAVHALVALGYRPIDAARMVQDVDQPELSSEALIRAALRAAVR